MLGGVRRQITNRLFATSSSSRVKAQSKWNHSKSKYNRVNWESSSSSNSNAWSKSNSNAWSKSNSNAWSNSNSNASSNSNSKAWSFSAFPTIRDSSVSSSSLSSSLSGKRSQRRQQQQNLPEEKDCAKTASNQNSVIKSTAINVHGSKTRITDTEVVATRPEDFNNQDPEFRQGEERVVGVIKALKKKRILSPTSMLMLQRIYFGRPNGQTTFFLRNHYKMDHATLMKIVKLGEDKIRDVCGEKVLKAMVNVKGSSVAEDGFLGLGSDDTPLPCDEIKLTHEEREEILDKVFPPSLLKSPQNLNMPSHLGMERKILEVPVTEREEHIMKDIVTGAKYTSLISSKKFASFQPPDLFSKLRDKQSKRSNKRK